MTQIEVGDRVRRGDRVDQYEVTGTLPVQDFQGVSQVWANLKNLRTGEPATSVNIEQLEKVQ